MRWYKWGVVRPQRDFVSRTEYYLLIRKFRSKKSALRFARMYNSPPRRGGYVAVGERAEVWSINRIEEADLRYYYESFVKVVQ